MLYACNQRFDMTETFKKNCELNKALLTCIVLLYIFSFYAVFSFQNFLVQRTVAFRLFVTNIV